MSFFCNFNSDRCPGPINGNPLNGLCDKVCVEVKKVFDACMRQAQEDNVIVTLQSVTPANPTYPLTFVSARSINTVATVTSLQVDPLPDRQNCSRVQITYTVPVEVVYTDANGIEGKGVANISLSQDVILFVPAPSIMPYEVEAIVSVVSDRKSVV